jgi:hypothetical protein
MFVLSRCGQHERVGAIAQKLRAGKSQDRELLVEVACCYALCAGAAADDAELKRRYTHEALATLGQAIAQGFQDRLCLETEPDLDPIRGEPGFKELVAKVNPR